MAERKNALNLTRKIIFFACILFFCLPFNNSLFSYTGDNISIKAVSKVSKGKVSIGERLIYTTTIFSDQDVEIDVPETGKFGAFEIRDSGIIREKHLVGNRIKLWYALTVYETGKQIIPGLKINYRLGQDQWKHLQSNNVNIYVRSVFERSKIEADIRPIEPPIGLKFPYTFHIIAGVPLLIAAFYSVGLSIKYGKRILEKKRKGPAQNLLIYRQLSDKLALLAGRTEFNKDDFIRLSGIIREYLGLNFGMNFGRLTTEEFLHSIKRYNDFYIKYGEDLSFVLRTCDMAKFANHTPGLEEYKRIFSLAGEIKKNILPNETQE